MDVRQVIAANADLLVTSLSPSSKDFMYHLLEKQLIEPYELKKHRELDTTIKQINDLISLICKRSSVDLANEFLHWLQTSGQEDLYKVITRSLPASVNSSNTGLTYDSTSAAGSAEDDDGESECESLGVSTTPILNIKGVLPTQQYVDDKLSDSSAVYPLSPTVRGVAMIVANSKFRFRPASLHRNGSEFDTNNLSKLFTWLGYEVLIYSNSTKQELVTRLHDLTRDRKQRAYSSFVLCLLSHGGVGFVTMADNSKIYTDEIIDRLDSNNFPAMAGKPKFLYIDTNNQDLALDSGFILPTTSSSMGWGGNATGSLSHIQIIQSKSVKNEHDMRKRAELSTPVIDEHLTSVACKADFVLYLASFPRYTALHNSKVGSITTRVFVEVFYKHAHKYHIAELAMKIRRKLCSKDILQTTKQVLTMVDTLTKDFFLFPLLS